MMQIHLQVPCANNFTYVVSGNMEPIKVVEHFGSVKAVCAATGLTHQAIYFWLKAGKVPRRWQLEFEEMTRKKLRRDPIAPRVYTPRVDRAAAE